MSKVMRSVKNVTKGYSSVQVKVREGTSVCGQLTARIHVVAASYKTEQLPLTFSRQQPATIHGVLPARK